MNDMLLKVDYELFRREHARRAFHRSEQDCPAWAMTAGSNRDRLHRRALNSMGRTMVRWGSRLQQRYGPRQAIPVLWATNDRVRAAR